jgi:hypothetical protein
VEFLEGSQNISPSTFKSLDNLSKNLVVLSKSSLGVSPGTYSQLMAHLNRVNVAMTSNKVAQEYRQSLLNRGVSGGPKAPAQAAATKAAQTAPSLPKMTQREMMTRLNEVVAKWSDDGIGFQYSVENRRLNRPEDIPRWIENLLNDVDVAKAQRTNKMKPTEDLQSLEKELKTMQAIHNRDYPERKRVK